MLYRLSHRIGTYGITIREDSDHRVLVQIEQVIKHPKQGDLHHPGETEGVFFHEKHVLSHYEERYAARSQSRDFNAEEMKYKDSLQQMITKMENELKQQHTEYAKLTLDNLNSLKEDYSVQYKQNFF